MNIIEKCEQYDINKWILEEGLESLMDRRKSIEENRGDIFQTKENGFFNRNLEK